ncbi:MAG: adenine deaminase C-terminal domain-containing protein [Natronomonas sp.]
MNTQQRTALGTEPADVVLRGGRACLVERGEFQDRDVVIRDGRVAALPRDLTEHIGPETTVMDLDDRPVVPGLIDAHTHADVLPIDQVYHHVLRGGTTGIVTESNAFGDYFPIEGPTQLLEATDDIPLEVGVSIPPQSTFELFEPQLADDETITRLASLLEHQRVVGVGEISWIYVVGRDSPVERLCSRARELGKLVTAHGAGCSGEKLTALATVADDDHEPITAEEFIERVENGMHAIGRYGSRDDIDALAAAYDELGPAELSLSTDGIGLGRLADEGYMNLVLKRAVEAGIEPADAVRMATLNPARHFGLTDRGSLAPGNYADVVVLEDLDSMAVKTVLFEGDVVVTDGEPLVEPRPHEYPTAFYESVSVTVHREDFRIPADTTDDTGAVRAIEFVGGMVTTSTSVEPPSANGELLANPEDDLLKAAVYNRHTESWGFVGFVTGFEIGADAVATTGTMQLPSVLAVGSDDHAMASAAERIDEIGGGWVVVDGGEITAEDSRPIAGAAPDRSIAEVRSSQRAVMDALHVGRSDARVGLASLTFTGVPALKLSFTGYADVLNRDLVGLTPDFKSN